MNKIKVLLPILTLLSLLLLSACSNEDQTTSASTSSQSSNAIATQVPTKPPAPDYARLGGTVHNFDLKFGKEDTCNDGIGYLPFGSYTLGQDLPTDMISISVENGHVEGVIVTLPKDSPLNWQDGTQFCKSFLPTDAVFKSDDDFSPMSQSYQQMYMSKEMAHMFSAGHFVEVTGINRQPLTTGTVQIMYYYSSFGDHTNNAQITICDVELGQPN